ncbi:MAG TPA: nicotinamide riboside transporter PnuC [Ferruginibacter sp.]|nr:nicotinamide riboside transporter PnuC [Ferruginibacter sp.]HMP22083.1 nicotinamide riboside transporter PnuC [Ferruginibacter sp.]
MTLEQWSALLWQQIKDTASLQWLAVAFAVAEVLLAKANKIWLYPAGIIATILSVFILLQAGLYAESLLNGYYFIMSVYGWWYWTKKKNKPVVKISFSNRSDWIVTLLIAIGSFAMLSFLLKQFTDSTVPYWDAWVSATAWAGMWLLSRRKIENWVWLNISNLFAIPLLIHKQMPLFAALTLFLFIVAVLGFIQWRKIISAEK